MIPELFVKFWRSRVWVFFIVLLFNLMGVSGAYAQDFDFGISDLELDRKPQLEYFFLNEPLSVREASGYHSEGNQRLIQRVRPYVVELLSPEKNGTGIVLGFNRKNQPIILTAGHLLMYKDFELANVTRIFLDQPHGNQAGSIVDELSHVVRPAWRGENSLTSKGWYGLSMFHPTYNVNESLIMREQKMDFGLYLMTGTTVAVDLTQENLDSKYTVRESINAGFDRPMLDTIKTARLRKNPMNKITPVGTRVLVMGVSKPNPASVPVVSAVFSNVLSDAMTERISKSYLLNLDTKIQYVVLGKFEKSMSGGGVFNDLGELVGIVTKVIKDRSGNSVGAIVLDIEHILENIEKMTNQMEVLKVVTDVKITARGFGRQCSKLF
jgi:hypothetical protein